MKRTLEEAIKYYSELAEENEKDAEQFKRIKATQDIISHCYECAKECAKKHRQLAEWLRELKAYRKAEKEIEQELVNWNDIDNGKCRGLYLATSIIQNYKNEEVNADDTNRCEN